VTGLQNDDATTRLPRSFSAVLLAAFVTSLGDGLRLTALPLLAASLTSSPFLISAVTAAQFLPWTTFAPFGGVIVDRSDRRHLIMVTQSWRAVVMALVGVLVVTDAVEIWHLLIVAFVITVGEILVDPSVVATIPTIVPAKQLDQANSRLSTVEIVTNDFVGGPVGAATFALAPWLPFVLDALSYLGSVLPFSRLPANEPRDTTVEEISVMSEMAGGLQWIRSHPFLRPVTAAIAVFNVGSAGAFSLLILLVTDVLDAPEIVFGIVLAAAAVGATVASLIAAWLTERFTRKLTISAAAVITALTVLAAAGSTASWQLISIYVLKGAAGGVLLSIGRGFVQRHTPNDRLGRTAIASRMITRTSFVLGALLSGVVATASSVRWAFVIAALIHLVACALFWQSFRHETDGWTAS